MLVSQVSTAFNSARDATALFASLEQSLPVRQEWLNFSRLRLRVERPLQFGPVTLNMKGRAGGVYGDLPPYEAFPIGGTNSVRWGGSHCNCLLGSHEDCVFLVNCSHDFSSRLHKIFGILLCIESKGAVGDVVSNVTNVCIRSLSLDFLCHFGGLWHIQRKDR